MSEMQEFTAGIVVIGNEILSGRTQDTNINWIAAKLTERGIRLREARVIPDDEAVIIETVLHFSKSYTYVFTTGGIGPTHDDITADSIAKAFGVKNVLNKEAYDRLLKHYGSETEFTSARQRMAHIPEGASLIDNPVSTAPGFKVENVHVMAGVPRIMQGMMDCILPTLIGGDVILSKTVSSALAESSIADELRALQGQYPQVDIGSYPHFKAGSVGVSIVVRGTDSALLDEVAEAVARIMSAKGGAVVF